LDHFSRIDDAIEIRRADGAELERRLFECQAAIQGVMLKCSRDRCV
jgi:hypothetical protein